MVQLNNPFSDETRELFVWNYACWICGMNGIDAAHHILGRRFSSSLNFCPIHNTVCHLNNGSLNRFEVQAKLLKKTLDFLQNIQYELVDEDKEFIRKNVRHYEQFLSKTDIKRLTR